MLVNERSTESVVRSTATQGGHSEPRSRPEKFSKVSTGLKKVARHLGLDLQPSLRNIPAFVFQHEISISACLLVSE